MMRFCFEYFPCPDYFAPSQITGFFFNMSAAFGA